MKSIVITGATSGIGFAVSERLLKKGYTVIGIGSSDTSCKIAREKILSEMPNADITYITADLLQQTEIIRAGKEIKSMLGGSLDILINNAGCVRSRYMTTEEGYEHQFALNHLAGFLLTHELLSCLINAKGRVIMTGSNSHKGARINWDDVMLSRRYGPLKAYKQSKLCNLLFAKALNDRGLHAYVVDPGLVKTEIGNKNTGALVKLIWSIRKHRGVCADIPAKTFEWLCSSEDPPAGLYYFSCKEKSYSQQVDEENADRLFAMSKELCGIKYDRINKS